jgi:hypothetical protein
MVKLKIKKWRYLIMNEKRIEVKFWNSANECICFGFQTSINFDDMESALQFVEAVTIENAKEITISEFQGYELINQESYEVL